MARALLAAAAVIWVACPLTPRAPHSWPDEERPGAARLPLELEVIPDPLRPAPVFSFTAPLHELHLHVNLTNRGARELELSSLSLSASRGDAQLSRYVLGRELLALRLRALPVVLVRDRQTLAVAARGLSRLGRPRGSTRLAPGETASLVHELRLERSESLPDAITLRVVASEAGTPGEAVRRVALLAAAPRTRLSLPLAGRAFVMAGHRFGEDHAEPAVASQRFAYDLGVLGPELLSFRGDRRRNASYLVWGRPVLAAADGVVAAVHDGVAENDPVGTRPSWRDSQRDPADLAGNFVVLRHEAAEHTAYLHLQPGLTLRVGDRVRRGEPVGRCGNSGNSREPHLHLQLQDGPDPLRAAAIPPRFGDFTILHGGLFLHVPADRPQPLPTGHAIERGRLEGAQLFRN